MLFHSLRTHMRRRLAAVGVVWSAVVAHADSRPPVIRVERSIQAALDSIPPDNPERVVVEIPAGVFNERIDLDQRRVTLRGAGRDKTRIRFNFPRSEFDKRYDRYGPGVVNAYGDDCVIEHLSIENTQPTEEHAFALYGQPQRLILDDCNVLGGGGDTASLWNTSYGMYYHRNCRFTGRVDFLCPRGWCFVRDCQFEELGRTATLWHDGHMDWRMKFVLRNCRFDGVEGFWLGRNHYPSQFYLLGCRFAASLADQPIVTVADLSNVPEGERSLYERKYFHDCHREGGDFTWHADNLELAPGRPAPEAATPAWTFDGQWDPESEAPPRIVSVETDGDLIVLQWSEPVAGIESTQILRADGSRARAVAGVGTHRLRFVGGTASSPPVRLEVEGDGPHGTVATLARRIAAAQTLPDAVPLRRITILAIGDSTVADYAPESPAQGWAWALRQLVDDRVTVINAARNGRSSKSFRDEGLWDAAAKTRADYVLIQFGHNDNPGKGPERQTDPSPGGDYRANLRRYVEEARARGATPVLISPPTRRVFGENGRIRTDEANVPYAAATAAVAAETKTPLADLNRLSRELFDRLGERTSDWTQVEDDRTHFSPAGARRIAALVLGELVAKAPELRSYVLPGALAPR